MCYCRAKGWLGRERRWTRTKLEKKRFRYNEEWKNHGRIGEGAEEKKTKNIEKSFKRTARTWCSRQVCVVSGTVTTLQHQGIAVSTITTSATGFWQTIEQVKHDWYYPAKNLLYWRPLTSFKWEKVADTDEDVRTKRPIGSPKEKQQAKARERERGISRCLYSM